MSTKTNIIRIKHPDYLAAIANWKKYRLTYEGGRAFVDTYLEKYSSRENNRDFQLRKKISACVGFAKSNLIDIKNAIYSRMVDINRQSTVKSYLDAVNGDNGGVDKQGSKMKRFIGTVVLPELLALGKVGIYIDRSVLPDSATKADVLEDYPYLYIYRAEDILSWAYTDGKLVSVLLKAKVDETDAVTGLVKGKTTNFRWLRLTESQTVEVTEYNKDGVFISKNIIDMPVIPFVISELSQSLLTDVADYQVMLTNMNSTDVFYALKANFPFYVEQYDPFSDLTYLRNASGDTDTNSDGSEENAQEANSASIEVGSVRGRRYPKGLEHPRFIHPGSEPLEASMAKQQKLEQDVRKLMNLALSSLAPQRVSKESKEYDDRGLEAGLSYIGMELEYCENQIAMIWGYYETGGKVDSKITYPTSYTLKSDAQRYKEASDLIGFGISVNSETYRKFVAERVIRTLMEGKTRQDDIQDAINEIKKLEDPALIVLEELRKYVDSGIVSKETASRITGFPDGDVDIAQKEHVERAIAIVEAQTSMQARGVNDLSVETSSPKLKVNDLSPESKPKVRGDE